MWSLRRNRERLIPPGRAEIKFDAGIVLPPQVTRQWRVCEQPRESRALIVPTLHEPLLVACATALLRVQDAVIC